MNVYITILLLGVSLSVDAFAVSVLNGFTTPGLKFKHMFFIAGAFGIMQGLMPLAGFYLGSLFMSYIEGAKKYISFALLAAIGAKMAADGIRSLKNKQTENEKKFSAPEILAQSLATSIDAFVSGIAIAALTVSIFHAASIIASVTFFVCFAGVFLGTKFGLFFKGKAGIASITGGAVLILLGISFLF